MRTAVVIPTYRVTSHILEVVRGIGPEVDRIYVVDDCCPDGSGTLVTSEIRDPRVSVIFHEANQGVGGATLTGMKQASDDGADVIVKVDGDGQMDARLISDFVLPIAAGEADYCKGNRFFYLDNLRGMPAHRIVGNAVLSFVTKVSSGYWDVFDPTNGFIALRAATFRNVEAHKVARRYFFESDMLFRLYLVGAVVRDIPIRSIYGAELSGLKVIHNAWPFAIGNVGNAIRRIGYTYYLRDLNMGSLLLPIGLLLTIFGLTFGVANWWSAGQRGVEASAGTVMLAALPIIIGFQSLLGFLTIDISKTPRLPQGRKE